ncbi:MAG TPA: caspase family protein [Smithellaceae bacterium]|nr:caspase family protein [Smithellaceae bacterium]HOQ71474.1 caspase family protein [Smithellaceae bacterium]
MTKKCFLKMVFSLLLTAVIAGLAPQDIFSQDRMGARGGRTIPMDRPAVAVPGANAGTASSTAQATAAPAGKTWFGATVRPVTGKDMRIMHMEYGRWPVVFVSEVVKESPAEKMGIRLNDIILSVNYKDIKTPGEFQDAVAALRPGDKIVLLVAHAGEKAQYISGTAESPPGGAKTAAAEKAVPAASPAVTAADIAAKIFAPTGSDTINAIRCSPDGKYLISGGGYKKDSLNLWDISAGKKIRAYRGHADAVNAVAFSPDGKTILSGSFDKTVNCWDVDAEQALWTFSGHEALILDVTFSPDGKYAASGSRDNTVKLLDAASGREVRTFSGHTDGVESIVFSPDGRYLLSGSFDKTLILWDVQTGDRLQTFEGHQWQIASVAFSPDGRQIFSRSGDRVVKSWDVAAGREIRTFTADDVNSAGAKSGSQGIRAGAFSADTRRMITTKSFGGAISLWDMDSGRILKKFAGHLGNVPAVAFLHNERYFLTGGQDGAIRIWDIDAGREIVQFVSLKDGEWIVLTPEGYYNSSLNGHKYLHIKVGGKVYGIDQFYDVFYRPDIVSAKIKGEDISSLVSLTIDEALKNPPPAVEFTTVPPQTDSPKVKVCYQAESTGGGIGEVRLFHNGKLIQSDGYYREVAKTSTGTTSLASLNSRSIYADMRSINIKAKTDAAFIASQAKGDRFEDCREIDAIAGENEVSVSAFNAGNTVQSYLKTITFNSGIKPEDPHLYIFSIGIDQYKDSSVNLKYAVKDAKELEAKIKAQSATLYRPQNIHYSLVTDQEANKTNIINKINALADTIKPQDSFILFVAGHGVLLQNQYYMLTHDFDGRINDAGVISSNEIVEMSKQIKALSQLFIFDTCHAGGVDTIISGLYDARMSVLARKMGLHIFASANDQQAAMDGYKGNGLFTYTLLDGLNNNKEADKYKDGKVSIVGLGEYARKMTTAISKQIRHEQTPLIINFGKDSPLYQVR